MEANTELINTTLPPKLTYLCFQEKRRFSIALTTGFQVLALLGFALTGRPR
jgi:hypothetical protein